MKQERSAERRKYHVIYKTTCLVTGRYYIGMHSTDDLADGYIGSGKRLWSSIKKHGASNHSCQVLEYLPSRKVLATREAEIVNEQLLEDKQCMNLTLGGHGSWEAANRSHTLESRNRATKAGYQAMNKSMTAEQVSARATKIMKATWKNHREKMLQAIEGYITKATIAAALPESIAKRKATFAVIGHAQGTKNPMYGKRWINRAGEVKIVADIEVDECLKHGWALGRTEVKPKSPSLAQSRLKQLHAEYQRLQPCCRNTACRKPITFEQHQKAITSCSKSCSNKTRIR